MTDPASPVPADDPLAPYAVAPEATLRQVVAVIDRNGKGVAVVVDAGRRFLGIVTDGDIRRLLLGDGDLSQPVGDYLAVKTGPGPTAPLTAPADLPEAEHLRMMEAYRVRHLPLIDEQGRLERVALKSDLDQGADLAVRAVVMAGGFGTRLRPFTNAVPKPLLPVGDKPLIEHIVGQLRESGIERVNITTHFHADKIRDHFGDGSRFGIDLQYTHEEKPLGTAGALGMLRGSDEPLLVINGDVLTAVDFRAMAEFHRENESDLTLAVRRYEVSVPFGVVEADGARVTRLTEKPSLSFFINAGIYLLEPSVLDFIPGEGRFDMTDLIALLLDKGCTVTRFPVHEYWLDIGQVEDYLRARDDVMEGVLTHGRE